MEQQIRQVIATVAGHVDHGKTSILDKIRETSIQEGEAGGITQKISFTTLPKEIIDKRAGKILEKFKIPLKIPGILFIDTPGHAAFTNLRKRGGSLADIAILVIDINEGIKPQTAEVLQILKANKVPFIVALNKIDNIGGWRTSESLLSYESVESQAMNVKQVFEERYYTLVGALNSYGFNPELYYKIDDFTKNLAVVPCSARTGEGISEILAMITALSQKYLGERIKIHESGKGVVLEVKKDKSINYLECILYDGKLTNKDEIAIASFDDTLVTKIRTIEEALPLNKGYKVKENVEAATGLKLQVTTKEEILPGMPFRVIEDNLERIEEEFCQEISEEIQVDEEGILVKADSLGSLEALLVLLREKGIRVIKAKIGPITKKDIYFAHSLEEENRVILGFNVDLSDEVKEMDELKKIKILTNPVVYQLIKEFEEWKMEKVKEMERQKLCELVDITKVEILDFVFRNSNPAVFGVRVFGGKLKRGCGLINKNDERIAQVKEIQKDRKGLEFEEKKDEEKISLPGVNFERQLEAGEFLYSNLAESQFRKFKECKELLTVEEKKILMEIAELKRKENPTWGI